MKHLKKTSEISISKHCSSSFSSFEPLALTHTIALQPIDLDMKYILSVGLHKKGITCTTCERKVEEITLFKKKNRNERKMKE